MSGIHVRGGCVLPRYGSRACAPATVRAVKGETTRAERATTIPHRVCGWVGVAIRVLLCKRACVTLVCSQVSRTSAPHRKAGPYCTGTTVQLQYACSLLLLPVRSNNSQPSECRQGQATKGVHSTVSLTPALHTCVTSCFIRVQLPMQGGVPFPTVRDTEGGECISQRGVLCCAVLCSLCDVVGACARASRVTREAGAWKATTYYVCTIHTLHLHYCS